MNLSRYPSYLPYLSESQKEWLGSMRAILGHNVPRFTAHILARGGVSKEEWEWLRCEDEDNSDCLAFILARADDYLLYPRLVDFRKTIFILVRGLAIMSFIPGGIEFLGLRFCSQIENFVEVEYEAGYNEQTQA